MKRCIVITTRVSRPTHLSALACTFPSPSSTSSCVRLRPSTYSQPMKLPPRSTDSTSTSTYTWTMSHTVHVHAHTTSHRVQVHGTVAPPTAAHALQRTVHLTLPKYHFPEHYKYVAINIYLNSLPTSKGLVPLPSCPAHLSLQYELLGEGESLIAPRLSRDGLSRPRCLASSGAAYTRQEEVDQAGVLGKVQPEP